MIRERLQRPRRKAIICCLYGFLWNKGLSVGTGQTPVRKHSVLLREMMIARVAKPSFIASHRLPLDKVPEAFIRGSMPGGRWIRQGDLQALSVSIQWWILSLILYLIHLLLHGLEDIRGPSVLTGKPPAGKGLSVLFFYSEILSKPFYPVSRALGSGKGLPYLSSDISPLPALWIGLGDHRWYPQPSSPPPWRSGSGRPRLPGCSRRVPALWPLEGPRHPYPPGRLRSSGARWPWI